MNELNPNHKTCQDLQDQWQKIAALVVHKSGGEVFISEKDLENMPKEGLFLAVNGKPDGILLKIITEKEAHKLVEQEGGKPN